ncbi:hypothetical protein ACH492_22240 [Streptomyces sp. NPDC019443]|uniref:hypothetical protein n=1 Tax=Streptomyces sp. NPDC019443 TaxID=3365061 RepID=UPI00378877B7
MRTHHMRPAAVLAWVLGIALILTCPQIVTAGIAAVGWVLTAPAGGAVLTVALLVTIGWCLARPTRRYRRGWS